jgi:hypothetical protein
MMEEEVAMIPALKPGTYEELVANVGDRVFFDFDKYDIRPDAQVRLESQADWLNRYRGITVSIEGHCDERGTREYNLALGERRANAVKNYLVRERGQELPRGAWRRSQPRDDDFLRQRTSCGRGLQRVLLVAEPARRADCRIGDESEPDA